MDQETKFLMRKLELDYGDIRVVPELKKIAKGIKELHGWPQDKQAFWNGESLMWSHKIDRDKRVIIGRELSFLQGKNLDLGCGSFSYLFSVGLDISSKMLKQNDQLINSVQGDLENELPFPDSSFDSVTLVFVINYLKNYTGLLGEISRILKKKGILVVVKSIKPVNKWQRQHQNNDFTGSQWVEIFQEAGFKVTSSIKQGLEFFKCKNF